MSKHPCTLNSWHEVPRWAGWISLPKNEFPHVLGGADQSLLFNRRSQLPLPTDAHPQHLRPKYLARHPWGAY